jgi:hypothetical protein
MRIISFTKYALVGVVFIASCTKLNETDLLYGQPTDSNFGQKDAEVVALIAAAYTNLYGSFG